MLSFSKLAEKNRAVSLTDGEAWFVEMDTRTGIVTDKHSRAGMCLTNILTRGPEIDIYGIPSLGAEISEIFREKKPTSHSSWSDSLQSRENSESSRVVLPYDLPKGEVNVARGLVRLMRQAGVEGATLVIEKNGPAQDFSMAIYYLAVPSAVPRQIAA